MSWKRGAYPEFTLEDAVATLFLLGEPTGRKTISEVLNIGEGSVRTLLKKLTNLGLIHSAQRGHSLTERGISLVRGIMENFSEAREVHRVDGYPAYAVVVRNPPEFKSIELRDEAIRYSAKGAMILVVNGGEVVFPEDGRPLGETMPALDGDIKRMPELDEGCLVVVTWAENPGDAMKSAYHVALVLKADALPEEIKSIEG
jgi:predicted transcriptional regulator